MNYPYFLLLLTLFSCGSPPPEEMRGYLNGYWEIEKVKLPDGSEKNFSINTTIDYIEVKDDSGVRKKVSPQPDGTFLTFEQQEQFKVIIRNDRLVLQYKTPYDQWEETVLKASPTVLVLLNKDLREYRYKPYQSIPYSK